MTASQFATRSTYFAMITDTVDKTVRFENALNFTCAMADCTMAQNKGLKTKAIRKADSAKWKAAAQQAGFSVIL